MQDLSTSQRFPALYKAVGKMNGAEQMVASPFGFDVEEDEAEWPVQVAARTPEEVEVRARVVVVEDVPMACVPAGTDSAERRAQRLARVRAERELLQARERVVKSVSQMRQAQAEGAVRESRSAVAAMERRLQSGGHTGRLAWMEAQVLKMRWMVSQA